MKGYTIQNSINLLEKNAKGGGPSGPTSAANVTFDNTGSDLVAANVQNALIELDNRSLYSTSKTKIGKWLDKDLFRQVFVFETPVDVTNTAFASTDIDASNIESIIDVKGLYAGGITFYPLMANLSDDTIKIQSDRNGTNVGATVTYLIVEFTEKTTTRTRKKK